MVNELLFHLPSITLILIQVALGVVKLELTNGMARHGQRQVKSMVKVKTIVQVMQLNMLTMEIY